jgi:GNAT superfamily N-acetyltransferase
MMIFRQASNDDIAGMQEVRLSVHENMISDPNLLPPDMYARYINEIGRGWVCEVNGGIVGFCIACLQDASVWALFVRPDRAGRGIGKRLLNTAVEWLFSSGVPVITLSTMIDTRAERFYEKQGWARGQLKANGEVEFSLARAKDNAETEDA